MIDCGKHAFTRCHRHCRSSFDGALESRFFVAMGKMSADV
jgi:hypothetical protein